VTIHSVHSPEGTADTTEEIMKVATQYYKNLFKYEARPNISLGDNFFSEEDKLSRDEMDILEEEFTKEEVKRAIFESYSDGAPEPDGLSFMFYHKFWRVIKGDLLEMFRNFHRGELDLYRLYIALITVIPKEKMPGQ
jgi:hypothetical protein